MDKEEMLIIQSAITSLENGVDTPMTSTLVDSAKQILNLYLNDDMVTLVAYSDGPILMKGTPSDPKEE